MPGTVEQRLLFGAVQQFTEQCTSARDRAHTMRLTLTGNGAILIITVA
jgi:hypothetical protein